MQATSRARSLVDEPLRCKWRTPRHVQHRLSRTPFRLTKVRATRCTIGPGRFRQLVDFMARPERFERRTPPGSQTSSAPIR